MNATSTFFRFQLKQCRQFRYRHTYLGVPICDRCVPLPLGVFFLRYVGAQVPECGHVPHLEQPEFTVSAIAGFLGATETKA